MIIQLLVLPALNGGVSRRIFDDGEEACSWQKTGRKALIRLVAAVFVTLFWCSVAFTQQPLTQAQQCINHQQELVLSDITYQELRARTGNIMRQAYELEAEVKNLKDENAKLKEEVRTLKASSEVQDVSAKTE